jgi:hypothetical protein
MPPVRFVIEVVAPKVKLTTPEQSQSPAVRVMFVFVPTLVVVPVESEVVFAATVPV